MAIRSFRLGLGAALLLGIAGCAPPPPATAQATPPPPSAARRIIDMQLAARPDPSAPPMNGDEASAIYQKYLERIGQPERAPRQSPQSVRGGAGGMAGTP
jgi:hypothetical protein